MKNVQVALQDAEYAQSLRNLLLRDGNHRVYLVDRADLRLDGVIVTEAGSLENLSMLEKEPERFVVVTRKGSDQLSRIWDAGVRHVVFEGDSPNTAQLAIIAAELRLPSGAGRSSRLSGPQGERHHPTPRASAPLIDSPRRSGRCYFAEIFWYGF